MNLGDVQWKFLVFECSEENGSGSFDVIAERKRKIAYSWPEILIGCNLTIPKRVIN